MSEHTAEKDAPDYAAVITQYESLREACYRAALADPARLGEGNQWLRTAFSNAGAAGIYQMGVTEEGVECYSTCWTNQTGGSTEFIEFTIPLHVIPRGAEDGLDTRWPWLPIRAALAEQ